MACFSDGWADQRVQEERVSCTPTLACSLRLLPIVTVNCLPAQPLGCDGGSTSAQGAIIRNLQLACDWQYVVCLVAGIIGRTLSQSKFLSLAMPPHLPVTAGLLRRDGMMRNGISTRSAIGQLWQALGFLARVGIAVDVAAGVRNDCSVGQRASGMSDELGSGLP